MSEQPKKTGRPEGSTGVPKKPLAFNITETLLDRLNELFPNPRKRTAFIEQALQMQIDILEGKIIIAENK